MKKLVATLTIAAACIVAAPAQAYNHSHGKWWYGDGSQFGVNNNSTVTAAEAKRICVIVIVWNESGRPVSSTTAHHRINSSALYATAYSSGGVVHTCLVDWDASGPTAGYEVTLYAGYRP